jgi:hypothetical protein
MLHCYFFQEIPKVGGILICAIQQHLILKLIVKKHHIIELRKKKSDMCTVVRVSIAQITIQ